MKTLIKNSAVYDSENRTARKGSVLISGSVIEKIIFDGDSDPSADNVIEAEGSLLAPGLVDVHTHGRCGFDFSSADAAELETMAVSYRGDGITSVFPTLASDTLDGLCDAARRINGFRFSEKESSRIFGGIHLEGRYINPAKRGAHNPELIVKPDAGELKTFIDAAGLPLHITSAPELDDGAFASLAVSSGATLGLGHSAATYAEASVFIARYGAALTHTYNAMPSVHHRDGGPVIAAFDNHAFCELICDGHHICPEMVAFTYRQTGSERLVLVSDSMSATASPDGIYSIAGTVAEVKNGIARTPDGALAGSTLTLPAAVENLADFCSIGILDALRCATLNPALETRTSDVCGIIGEGRQADLILCRPSDAPSSHRLNMYAVISGGSLYASHYTAK